jgi:hypothetical protein
MPYVKVYKGERETGKMLDCIITKDDGTSVDLGPYPEKESVWVEEWQTPWQPEHAPVGSVVRYSTSAREEMNEVTVTGHVWNGPQSWVILTNDPCPIMGADKLASFNGAHLKEIVSRGTGGVQWHYNTDNEDYLRNKHKAVMETIPVGLKNKHNYAARQPYELIQHVCSTHPKLAFLHGDMHLYELDWHELSLDDPTLGGIIKYHKQTYWSGFYVANKKRLVKALLRMTARHKVSAYKEQRAQDQQYAAWANEDMED